MPIKVVFCDIGNVLVRNSASEIYQKYYDKYGIPKETFGSVFDFIHTGQSTSDLDKFIKTKNLDPKIWEEFTNDFFSSENRNDNLYRLLEEAKANLGVKIIYTTNNSVGLQDILEKYSISDLPDLTVNSSLIGVIKPSMEYWAKAFDLSKSLIPGLVYDQVLVIDDSSTNIDSAKNFGFQVIHYQGNTSDQLIKNTLYPIEVQAQNIILSDPSGIEKYINEL